MAPLRRRFSVAVGFSETHFAWRDRLVHPVPSAIGVSLDDESPFTATDVGRVVDPVAGGESLPGNGDVGVNAEGAARIAAWISVASWNSAVLRAAPGWMPSLFNRWVSWPVPMGRPG
jgi:hypothetical protein